MTRMLAIICGVLASGTLQAETIAVNQLGYFPTGDKHAYIMSSNIKTVALHSLETGKEVLQLDVVDTTTLPDERLLGKIKFSDYSQPGWYQLTHGDFQSVPFLIASDAYRDLNQRLVHALYLQRSGMMVNDPSTGMRRPESHMEDGLIFRSDSFHKKGSYLDVTGGWYDAGDFGKYVATTTITVARLLEAYRQAPTLYSSGDTMPPVLQEAIYGLDWLLKMQREDGAVYRKVSGAKWPAKVGPWQDLQTRYIYGVSSPETGKFAGVMAFASRILAPYDAQLARQYLRASIHAANYLELQPEQYIDWQAGDDSGSGPYVKNKIDIEASLETDADDRLWAFAELYITTGQSKYLDLFKQNYDPKWIDIFEWKNPALMGVWHLILEEQGELRDRLAKDLQVVADRYVAQAQSSPFQIANQRFIWGSNKMTAEAGILVAWSDFANAAKENRGTVQAQIDYLLGANAFDLSFVTQSGTYAVRNLHHLYQIGTGVSLPGFMVGGPNELAQAGVAPKNMGMLSYVDSNKSYAVNEFAIDYNASLIGLLAVHKAYFN